MAAIPVPHGPPPGSAPRVSFVSSHAQMGGSEHYLELLLAELDPASIAGVVCLEEGPLAARLRERAHRVSVVATPPRLGMLPAAVRVRRALRAQHGQVVHANGVKAALVCALALAGSGVPVVWVKHDFSWDGTLARAIARGCRLVVGVSAAVTETFTGRIRRRVRVVHNGISEPLPDRAAGATALAELTGRSEGPVVGLTGRLHPAKGQIELVECVPAILERRPEARFVLIGADDPYTTAYAERLRLRVAELGLEERILFAGHRQDALDLMSACHVVVIPSVRDERGMGREGFGFVGVECMALGTPVAGYADGALTEVIGECGSLVAPGDRAALTGAILELLEDGELRARLEACGRERVRNQFGLRAMVDGMRACYVEAAAGARS